MTFQNGYGRRYELHDVIGDRLQYRSRHRGGEDSIARIACRQAVGARRKFARDEDDDPALRNLGRANSGRTIEEGDGPSGNVQR